MKNINMTRIITRFCNVISERLTTHGAIQELIDNAIDAGAKNIVVNLDNKTTMILRDYGFQIQFF